MLSPVFIFGFQCIAQYSYVLFSESVGGHVHCTKAMQRHDECWPTPGIWCKRAIHWSKRNKVTMDKLYHHPHIYLTLTLSQGKIVAQGRLLLQDTFLVSDSDGGLVGRMKERRIFLFEQIVIFSEPLDKKRGFSMPGFLYKNGIKVPSSVQESLMSLYPYGGVLAAIIICVYVCRWAVWGWRTLQTETHVNLPWPPECPTAALRPLSYTPPILESGRSGACR